MLFSDLLNQPLPSKVDSDYITEATNPAKIAADVQELNKKYRASTKAIKEKIASVRGAMKSKKFQAALNVINNCRKDVIGDRNEISKRIKAIESAGLNKNTIRAVMAGTAVVAGAKAAYDVNKSIKLKKASDEAFNKDSRALTKSGWADEDLNIAAYKKKEALDQIELISKRISKLEEENKTLNKRAQDNVDTTVDKLADLSDKGLSKDEFKATRHKLSEETKATNAPLRKKIDKNNAEIKKLKEQRGGIDTKALTQKVNDALDKRNAAVNQVSRTFNKWADANTKEKNHTKVAIGSGTALLAGGGVTYAVIKLFMLIKDNYEKYYDGVQKTLDELEDKCEKQSQNIKECLLDFVILSQDIEMLMESVEESEYMEAGKVENINKIRIEVKKYKTMSKEALKDLKAMVSKIKEQIKEGDFKSAKQSITSCRTKLNKYISEENKQYELIKSLGLNDKNLDKARNTSHKIMNASTAVAGALLVSAGARLATKGKSDNINKVNNSLYAGNKVAIGVSLATLLGWTYVNSYYKCTIATSTYFGELDNILDDLEKKCKAKSRDIKESMIDFVIASQDMEMVLESAEEIDYIDEE